MAAPDQLYIEFDAASPEESRTIDFSGESQTKKSNEYNISVFNADGSPDRSSVVGMVSMSAYSPGSDRAEQTDNTVDLSTGCRKFNLFFATIQRAVFSVNGAVPGKTIRVSAIRSRGLVVTARDLNPLIPVNLLQWTPDFAGAGSIPILEWAPLGDYELVCTVTINVYKNFNTIYDHLNNSDDGEMWIDSSRILNWRPRATITVRIQNIPLGVPVLIQAKKSGGFYTLSAIGETDSLPVGTDTAFSDIVGGFGGINSGNTKLDGQIITYGLTDLTTPSNSRFYPMVIESETQPTTLNLIDQFNPNPLPAPVLYIPLRDNLDIVVGDGSTAFARAGEATFVRDGVLGLVGIDEARFEADGVKVEGASVQTLTDTLSDGTTTGWDQNLSPEIDINQPSPDGFNNAFRMTVNSSFEGLFRADSRNNSVISTNSIWLKGVNGGELVVIGFNSDQFTVTLTTEWALYSRTSAAGTSSTTVLYSGTSLTQSFFCFLSNVDDVPFADSSVISGLTRPRDELTVPFPISGDGDFTIFITVVIDGFITDFSDILTFEVGADGLRIEIFDNGGVNAIRAFGGGVGGGVSFDESYSLGDSLVIAISSSGSTLKVYSNGTFQNQIDVSTVTVSTSVQIGADIFGNFQNYQIYDYTLTDAEILLVSNSPVPLNLRPPTSGTLTNFPAGMEWTEVITG